MEKNFYAETWNSTAMRNFFVNHSTFRYRKHATNSSELHFTLQLKNSEVEGRLATKSTS